MTKFESDEASDVERNRPPLKAIREHCLWCCNGSSREVSLCVSKSCPLWLYRSGHRATVDMTATGDSVPTHPSEIPMTQRELQGYSTIRAIKRRCLDCSGGSAQAVTSYKVTDCSLHEHRLRKGAKKLTGEALEASRARLAAAWAGG